MKPYLFVDFSGTLSNDKYWRSLPEDKFAILQRHFFGQNMNMVRNWMRGQYTSEQINIVAANQVGMNPLELWEIFVRDCETFSVEEETLAMIQALRNKYTVVLITENMDCFDRFVVPHLNLDDYFDHICNTWNEGRLKSDENGSLFLKYAGDGIEKAYLVDDSSSAGVVFRALGGTHFHVQGLEHTREYLAKL